VTAWALHTLAATTLLMIVVLVIRRPVARAFGARAAYALWLAPAMRLFLPPVPTGSTKAPQFAIETSVVPGTAALPFDAAPEPGLAQMLLVAWLAGAAVFLLFQVASHRRFVARALRHGRQIAAPAGDSPELIESAVLQGPVATGMFRKRILVPVGLAQRLDERQFRLALLHEQLHHRRLDLHALAVGLLVLALNWFNPIAHLAHRAFRRDLEAACDAQLAQDLSGEEREDYARAIIGCAAAPVPHAICTLTTVDDLKGRVKMLKMTHGFAARMAGTALAAMIAAAGLAATAQAQAAPDAQPKKERVEFRRIVKDGKVVEQSGMPADFRERLGKCDGEKFEAETDAPAGGDKKQKNKVFICLKGGSSPAATAGILEKTLKELETDGELRGPGKEQILAQVRARIAELRAR
jgi:beta-lactamase regulating signal transducer with metallopeptidase domain